MKRKQPSVSRLAGTGNWRSPGAANPVGRACRAAAGFDSQTGLSPLVALAFVILAAAPAWAAEQGCPMCREAAEATGDGEAFNAGILLMLGLVYGFGAIFAWTAWRSSRTEEARNRIFKSIGRRP